MAHTALHRTVQIARHWSKGGCPVVIHIDKSVPTQDYDSLVSSLSDLSTVAFCERHRCEWGTWGLVAAAQSGASLLLEKHPDVDHVYLSSGSCLPLRPVSELVEYVARRPGVDFIESATTEDVAWTIGGLDIERFTLRFPFSWRRSPRLFDRYVKFQRRFRIKRRIPRGLIPHLGSQWWCLSRTTLEAILNDPHRRTYDRYFKRVWIPDESYFQTLARRHSTSIESRSLTLAKFDFQGKPHIFYDDHREILRRSDCFVVRKIWPDAHGLYDYFLSDSPKLTKGSAEPKPRKIERLLENATLRRTKGREGLAMQSRFSKPHFTKGRTAGKYSVFEGFSDLFDDFEQWLSNATGCDVHGHLFASRHVEFKNRVDVHNGCQTNNPKLRDRHPESFIRNLIWNAKGERQCFQFGPQDNLDAGWLIAEDPHAQVSVITGAWAIRLFKTNASFAELRAEAARLQKLESAHIDALRWHDQQGRVRIWSLEEFVEAPAEPLQQIINEIGPRALRRITKMPQMVDLTGFAAFIQRLKNEGMHPYLVGEFTQAEERTTPDRDPKQS